MANQIIFNNLEELDYGQREAFNSLRTNLQFCGADLKVLLFTSCAPNEGKSTVTFQLARSMAENNKKVVLVDADLRKSVMLGRYKAQAADKKVGGLSHYLSKQAQISDILFATNIPNFDVILTGPLSPNPTELLGGPLFSELIERLRESYDMVIIDSPPLASVIDAAVMAPCCDGAVLVIESNATSHRMAVNVKKQLEMANCKILGAVLNKVKRDNSRYYYKYKHYGEYK
ncbi:CpsD/CapB family tyrosine-protein kinase [Zhenpiania hominis]|uniref:non-specific protein-tyrosine kinase n=1 Tax=Zhenpiania hominis TaxID=2763644 RepID=A0A923NQZ2_9FIRM|nr:CpsD/CapB family tyrosine-protein kinase [Zhenpiania hominis]MBC6681065.1 CpsD/CapB family tyrosine-protein kinase [Zhenpiania hominis]